MKKKHVINSKPMNETVITYKKFNVTGSFKITLKNN